MPDDLQGAQNSARSNVACPRCGTTLGSLAGSLCPRCAGASAFSLEDEPEPVKRIGDYELMEEVGRGGMGVVYRAVQSSLRRTVAVKVLRDSVLASPADHERFRTEAAAAGLLQHPCIVRIMEAGEWEGMPFFSMDYVDGPSLAVLTGDGPVEPAQAARWMASVARAMEHAHERGVLHRDLKPSNVLIAPDGTPRVTDFGLARREDMATDLTVTGQIMGTLAYMAPEQAAGLRGASGPATDIFGLGALLYHLLTGRGPFAGGHAQRDAAARE